MDSQQLHILRHSLGLDRGSQSYRNHFVTGKGSKDHDNCLSLVEQGYMSHCGNLGELTGGNDLFAVTEKGMEIAVNFELKESK